MITNLNGIARYPATAHIPGEGPVGYGCGLCKYFEPCKDQNRGRCILHWRFRGIASVFEVPRDEREEGWWRGYGSISAATPSCKYWELKDGGA